MREIASNLSDVVIKYITLSSNNVYFYQMMRDSIKSRVAIIVEVK
jgi:hypothetical protein